jgi:hypothetical protein
VAKFEKRLSPKVTKIVNFMRNKVEGKRDKGKRDRQETEKKYILEAGETTSSCERQYNQNQTQEEYTLPIPSRNRFNP